MEQDVLAALARVLGRPVEARADTPLAALGFEPAAWPALAEAVDGVARIRDADVRGVVTYADLLAVVAACVVRA